MFLLLPQAGAAQPGWRELEFSFVLEHHGVEVPAKDLRNGNDHILEIDGERVRPFSYNGSRFSPLRFHAERSDITMHRDTLWLHIRHRDEGVMAIAFPPRAGLRTNHPCATENMVVSFAPGRISVTDLPTFLLVTGTVVGPDPLVEFFPGSSPAASFGCDTVLG